MKIEGNHLDTLLAVSQQLRACTWDIVESWMDETKLNLNREHSYPGVDADGAIDDLPTLVGGVAKVVQDPMFLMDLEPGGNLYLVARQVGILRHETGYQIDRLLYDLGLLRQKVWLCCEQIMPRDVDILFELERRLNLSFDRILAAAADAYHQRASAEFIELAQKDKLTGFLHQKAFAQILDREFARAKRHQRPLSLISADLDNFKKFNVEEGRLEGNRMMRQISGDIMKVIRYTDYAGRLAGDEFAFILPETTAGQAHHAGERIRRSIRGARREDQPATASIGIASFPDNTDDKAELLKMARLAMSRAQTDGGDVIR